MKKVSVVITCYNQSEYLKETVKSVINSTYQNVEIIVVNDGSKDKTPQEIQNILSDYDNIILINQENQGVCTARNNGIKNASGEYILVLDADDKISNEYIEKAVSILNNNEDIGIVYSKAEFFGNEPNKTWNVKPATLFNMLLQNRIFSSAVYRKSEFLKAGGYKKEMELGCEDWELFLSMMENGVKIYKIPGVHFFYRINGNFRTRQALNPFNYLKIRLNIIRLHKNLYKKFGIIIYFLLSLKICKNFAAYFYRKLKLKYKIYCMYYMSLRYRKPLKYGVTKQKNKPKLIVSLTSFNERINEVHFTINSLLHQSLKPDEIVLWLSNEEFKNKEKDLPKSLIELTKYGLTIKFYPKNIKSYKKIIPAILNYPNDIVVLADDDLYYKKNWLELLYKSYLKNPKVIHCHRMHRMNFDENNKIMPYYSFEKLVTQQFDNEIYLATSGAGMLLPFPGNNLFYKDITNEELFMQLAPNADDLWIWTMATLNNTEFKLVENNISDLIYVNPKREYGLTSQTTLYKTNSQGGNDEQLLNILNHYPEIEKIISDKRQK